MSLPIYEAKPSLMLITLLFTMGLIPRQLAAALQSVNEQVHSQTPQCFGFDVSHRVPVEIPTQCVLGNRGCQAERSLRRNPERYEITFLEIGTDDDHVHFFVQSVPMYSPKQIVQIIKSLTAREIFKCCPQVKAYLWGGKFWGEGYFVSTVGAHGTEQMIKNYVRQQGKIDEEDQLDLF